MAQILVLVAMLFVGFVPTVPFVAAYVAGLRWLQNRAARIAGRVLAAVYVWGLLRVAADLSAERFDGGLGTVLQYTTVGSVICIVLAEGVFALRRHEGRATQPPRCRSCGARALRAVGEARGETAGGMYGLGGVELRCERCGALAWSKR